MSAIVLLPVLRNIHSLIKYNMSFSEYEKNLIKELCGNDTCLYISKFYLDVYAIATLLIGVPSSIVFAYFSIYINGYKDNIYMDLAIILLTCFLHIDTIYVYLIYLYDRCVITSSLVFIRNTRTKYTFTTVPLHSIVQYGKWSGLYGNKGIFILTNNNKKFSFSSIGNWNEFIAVLKTNSHGIQTGENYE